MSRHWSGSCRGIHELRDVRRSKSVPTAREIAGVCLLRAQMDHLAKTELGQSNGKVLRADAREPRFAGSGSIIGHRAGDRGFLRWQIDVWKHETEDDLARR